MLRLRYTDLPGIGCGVLLFWVDFADGVGLGLWFGRRFAGTVRKRAISDRPYGLCGGEGLRLGRGIAKRTGFPSPQSPCGDSSPWGQEEPLGAGIAA